MGTLVYEDTGLWGHWIMGTLVYGEHWIMGTLVYGDTGLWGHWFMGTLDYGDTGLWGHWLIVTLAPPEVLMCSGSCKFRISSHSRWNVCLIRYYVCSSKV